jgi:hypothetical protein
MLFFSSPENGGVPSSTDDSGGSDRSGETRNAMLVYRQLFFLKMGRFVPVCVHRDRGHWNRSSFTGSPSFKPVGRLTCVGAVPGTNSTDVTVPSPFQW